MKILLDENLLKQLKADFGDDYDVKTVRDMGWMGKKNGELLGLIVFNGFDFFLTIDALTPGCQRGYLLHFSAPEQAKIRESGIEKCMEQMLNGKGLNDC